MKQTISHKIKPILIGASLFSLGIGFFAGWNELHAVLVIGFLAFIALLFTAHFDQISEFKATSSGIEAKTREVLTQAENTITELQSLARIFAETTLSSVKRTGRMGSYEDEEEENIKNSVLDVLKQIGVPDSEYEQVLSDWYRFTEFDYIMALLGGNTIPQGFDDQNIHQEWKMLRNFNKMPTPTEIRNFLVKWELLDSDHSEYISDYEYYISNRKHRRPTIWKERKLWGVLKKP